MVLLYIANVRLPTGKAHGIQIMKTCESFAESGVNVELLAPRRFNDLRGDPFDYYNVKRNFIVSRVFSFNLPGFKLGRIGFWIQQLSFSFFAALRACFKRADIIYARDVLALFFLGVFKKNLCVELHVNKYDFLTKSVIKKSFGVVVISRGLKDFYIQKGVEPGKIFVAPDGVDLKKFDLNLSKEQCRKKLKLPEDKKLILYAGSLYEWKGSRTLAEASKYLDKDEMIVLVGGTHKDSKDFRERYRQDKNVLVLGYRLPERVPLYLKAADVLVLPNTSKNEVAAVYTSPMKLFEYMASSRPIVASDLPSLREVLSSDNAILVEPDSPQALSRGIKKALEDTNLAAQISRQAYLDVGNYTWAKRAVGIRDFLLSLQNRL